MANANVQQTPTIMNTLKKLQKCCVTYPVYTNFCVYIFFKILNIMFLLWNLIPEVTFFITNLHDVKVCTSVMSTLCQLLTTLFKVLYLVVKHQAYANVFLAFELYTKERIFKCDDNAVIYVQAEKKSSRLTIWFLISILLYAVVYIIPPLAYQIYLFIVQIDMNESTYIIPFKHVYFYSVNSNLRYFFTVTMGVISTILMGLSYLSIDLALFSYCLYIQAFLKDLQTMFKLTATQDNVAQLKDAINMHTHILQMIRQLNTLFSPIIFAQFLDSSLIICTVIFQSTLESSMQSETVKNISFVFGATCQILFYSYFGTIVLNENYNIAMTAYSSDWTDTSLKNNLVIRKYILFIIHRSQIEVGLDGLKLFKCNLQTFISIMNASLSSLAVLQSMSM